MNPKKNEKKGINKDFERSYIPEYPYVDFEAMANKLGIPYRAVRAGLNGYFPLTVSGPDPGKIGNIQMLGNLVDVEQFSLGVHVDGDGDRMGASRHGKIIPAPYLGALRALQAGPGKFIMEYCLA